MAMNVWTMPATIDWCEENYAFSSIVAELANSFSNILGIGLAVHGCHFSLAQKLPLRYFICFLLFLIVGVGSFLFHASLKYSMQLLDEIPMILCVSQSAYILLAGSARRWNFLTAAILAFDTTFVAAYVAYPNPIFHEIVFGCLMLLTAGRALFLLGVFDEEPILSEEARKAISMLLWSGAGTFVLAFAIWNLDNMRCAELTTWREMVGFPSAFLLEGHAWWHVLSAVGTYSMLVGVTYMSLCLAEGEDSYALKFTRGLPIVRRLPSPAAPAEKSK